MATSCACVLRKLKLKLAAVGLGWHARFTGLCAVCQIGLSGEWLAGQRGVTTLYETERNVKHQF